MEWEYMKNYCCWNNEKIIKRLHRFFDFHKKNLEPKVKYTIAPTRKIDEIGSGIPFEEIYSTVFTKPYISPGMAEKNIAKIDSLEKNLKKILYFCFIIKNFS
tara:strand:- start:687 stop:992 length:306 start_codon:yes stop_codon:yes gene_type:complete